MHGKFRSFFIFPSSIGYRTDAVDLDLSDILPADVEAQVKEAAEISMGTEISEEDITNIRHLCAQVCLVELVKLPRFDVRISLQEWKEGRKKKSIIYDDVSYRPSLNTHRLIGPILRLLA